MNQPDLFPFLDEVGEDSQKRPIFNIQVLDVCRPYPDRTFYLWDQGDNLLEVVLVCNVLRHGREYNHQPNYTFKRSRKSATVSISMPSYFPMESKSLSPLTI